MNKKAFLAVAGAALLAGALFLWLGNRDAADSSAAAAVAKSKAAPPAPELLGPPEAVDLPMALEQKRVVAEFIGNGRDHMRAMMMDKSGAPLHVLIPVGQLFESERNQVANLHPQTVILYPGKTQEVDFQTVAVHSWNNVADVPYAPSYASIPRIESLLTYIQERPEIPVGAIQTAVLALTENLPLSSFAKFTLASNPLPSRFNTDAFRADTFDIVTALTLLRDLKVDEQRLTLTIDPQLKIEAMIDPNARPVAMRYYGIDPEREWDFWRNELLNGEPATRHYALYGIARFYPDVALQMLPRWARETRTNPVYRLSAVQALADTQRNEALTELRQLAEDLGHTTELGKAATGAADYLEYRLAQISSARAVAFRTSATHSGADGVLR